MCAAWKCLENLEKTDQGFEKICTKFFHVTDSSFKKIKWICLKPRSDDDQDCVKQPEFEDQVVGMDGKSVGDVLTLDSHLNPQRKTHLCPKAVSLPLTIVKKFTSWCGKDAEKTKKRPTTC